MVGFTESQFNSSQSIFVLFTMKRICLIINVLLVFASFDGALADSNNIDSVRNFYNHGQFAQAITVADSLLELGV